MRQTGILAAACLHALSKAEENLTKDHRNAQKLSIGISECAKEIFKVWMVETNIVNVEIMYKSLKISTVVQRLANVSFAIKTNKFMNTIRCDV